MNKNRQRCLGLAALTALTGACSVDTSDVHFVPDDVFAMANSNTGDTGAGGDPDTGGAANIGGVVNVAGVLNKAGMTGKAGAGNGGSSTTGGAPPVGGSNTAGMPGGGTNSRCPVAVGNPTEPLIDNLEDGDPKLPMFGGREGGWYVSNDGSAGGKQMPPPNGPPTPDKPGAPLNGVMTAAAMHMSGSGFTTWGANMGLTLLMPPGSGACPYDVSPHRGVRFSLRTQVMTKVRFTMPTTDTHAPAQGGTCTMACGDHFGTDITPTATWARYEVAFVDLKQGGFGSATKFYPENVLNVEWSVGRSVDFDFWVDQVEFF